MGPRDVTAEVASALDLTAAISPSGRLFLEAATAQPAPSRNPKANRIARAFAENQAQGILYLATSDLQSNLPPALAFVRSFGCLYLTRLCHTPETDGQPSLSPVPAPGREELPDIALAAPPLRGLEYLKADILSAWWSELDEFVRREIRAASQGVQ